MRDTVDYRLLERFRAHRRLNLEPHGPPSGQTRAAAAEARPAGEASRRVRALDLRD